MFRYVSFSRDNELVESEPCRRGHIHEDTPSIHNNPFDRILEEKIKKFIGLGILSQAGVAIGLSLIIKNEFAKLAAVHPEAFARLAESDPLLHPVALGATVITTITATCIIFEIIGPILTKIALQKAGEINMQRDKV